MTETNYYEVRRTDHGMSEFLGRFGSYAAARAFVDERPCTIGSRSYRISDALQVIDEIEG